MACRAFPQQCGQSSRRGIRLGQESRDRCRWWDRPESQRVVGGGHNRFPVREELCRSHYSGVPAEDRQLSAGPHLPNSNGAIRTGRHQSPAVVREVNQLNAVGLVSLKPPYYFATGKIPEKHGRTGPGGCQFRTVRAEGDVDDLSAMPTECGTLFTTSHVPDANEIIAKPDGDSLAVRTERGRLRPIPDDAKLGPAGTVNQLTHLLARLDIPDASEGVIAAARTAHRVAAASRPGALVRPRRDTGVRVRLNVRPRSTSVGIPMVAPLLCLRRHRQNLLAVRAEQGRQQGILVARRTWSSLPLIASQIRAVPSHEPVKIFFPSGLNRADWIRSSCRRR